MLIIDYYCYKNFTLYTLFYFKMNNMILLTHVNVEIIEYITKNIGTITRIVSYMPKIYMSDNEHRFQRVLFL